MSVTNALNINSDGLPIFNESTGQFSATELSAKGDLLGFTGTVYDRFPIGQNGYVLKADSAEDLGWRWACPHYEFISSQTASNSATIEFTDFQDSDCFGGYKILFKGVERTEAELILQMRFSVDNGSTWISTGYSYAREGSRDDATYSFFSGSGETQFSLAQWPAASEQLHWWSGEIFILESATPTTTLKQGYVYQQAILGTPSSTLTHTRGGGLLETNSSPINGIQFFMDTGTITAGEFYLYGMLK